MRDFQLFQRYYFAGVPHTRNSGPEGLAFFKHTIFAAHVLRPQTMPLVRTETVNGACVWGLWETTETLPQLYGLWNANEPDAAYFSDFSHQGRLRQTLASRVLVRHLVQSRGGQYVGISKNAAGKPCLPGSGFHVSVSHTEGYAAAILHQSRAVGIDIEPVKEKLIRIAPRILSPNECRDAGGDPEKICVYWCAKEALYKLYGCRQLSFREHIRLHNFEMRDYGTLFGEIRTHSHWTGFAVFYRKVHNFIMAYSYESEHTTTFDTTAIE